MAKAETLAERIEKVRADAEAYIDARAAELKAEFDSIPLGALRAQLTRGNGCACAVVERLLEGN